MNSKQNKLKFTIIELMLVISIIMILLTILLPALKLAKEKASAINCLGKIKTAGVAWHNYADDYNDYSVICWRHHTIANNNAFPPYDEYTYRWYGQILSKYTNDPTDFFCMRDDATQDPMYNYYYWFAGGTGGNNYYYAYNHMAFSCGHPGFEKSVKRSRASKPSLLGLMVELDTREVAKPASWPGRIRGTPMTHGSTVNTVFTDGHADALNINDPVITNRTYQDTQLYWTDL